MKICICISGQLRGDISHIVKIKETLEKNYNVNFIFSLWKESGVKIDGALGHSQMFRIFEPDLAKIIPRNFYGSNLWHNLPKTRRKLEKQDNLDLKKLIRKNFPDAIIDIEENILDLEFPYHCGDKNSIKMLYKRWRCNEIKKNIEKKNSLFDLIIVMRPDIYLEFPEKLNEIKDGVIYCPDRCDENYINDVYAIGSSKTIDTYCQLFSKSISKDKWEGIHFELSQINNIKFSSKHNIINKGLTKNKLIKINDITEDSHFIKRLINNDIEVEKLTMFEKESYYLYQMENSTSNNDKLSNLIKSDISTRFFENITSDRNRYFFTTFISLINSSDNFYSNAKELALDYNINLNTTAIENINLILNTKNYKSSHSKSIIKKSYLKKSTTTLKNNIVPENIPDESADILRDWALSLENENIEDALYLINLAKIARPSGIYIKKIHQRLKANYEKTNN